MTANNGAFHDGRERPRGVLDGVRVLDLTQGSFN